MATDDDGDRRRRRRPDETESTTSSLHLRCHPQVSALSIASCQLELRPSLHRQLLSSPPVIDVDRDRLWGDGLAASSPVGLCRKFRREAHRRRGLNGKGLQSPRRPTSCHVSGFVGFRSSATRLSVHPLQLRGSRSLRKVVPSCKVTGRLPIERKPVDNASQKKRSPPHSLLSSTARFSLSRCLHYWHRRRERSQSHFSHTIGSK